MKSNFKLIIHFHIHNIPLFSLEILRDALGRLPGDFDDGNGDFFTVKQDLQDIRSGLGGLFSQGDLSGGSDVAVAYRDAGRALDTMDRLGTLQVKPYVENVYNCAAEGLPFSNLKPTDRCKGRTYAALTNNGK